jgi:hypothetical protein
LTELALNKACAQRRPRSGAEIAVADRRHGIRPHNSEVRVVITHRDILRRVVRAIDPIAHISDLTEHLEAMQHARRDEQVPEPFVIETECLVSAEGPRGWASVDDDIQDCAASAAHELGLAAPHASMQSPDDSAVRPRLRVLPKRRAVNAMRSGDGDIERSRKETTFVVMWLREKDQHTVKRRPQHLHEPDSDIRVKPLVGHHG